jgi:hypothetical protein
MVRLFIVALGFALGSFEAYCTPPVCYQIGLKEDVLPASTQILCLNQTLESLQPGSPVIIELINRDCCNERITAKFFYSFIGGGVFPDSNRMILGPAPLADSLANSLAIHFNGRIKDGKESGVLRIGQTEFFYQLSEL